jgi:hypothetical protein
MSVRYCRSALIAAVALTAGAGCAAAQSATRPQLVIGMTAGWVTGPQLWHVDRQLVPVWSGAVDSVSLQRLFRTGFIAGVGATLYRTPQLGYSVEITFLGLPTESRCAPLGPYAADGQAINNRTCVAIQGRGVATTAAAFQAGLTWRARPSDALQPYVRGMAGIAALGGSFVTSEGDFTVPTADPTRPQTVLTRSLLTDPKTRVLTWVASLAVGASLRVNEGYRVRFEFRDVILNVPVPSGPSTLMVGQPYAPIGNRTVHLPGFSVAFDLLMERERVRRY